MLPLCGFLMHRPIPDIHSARRIGCALWEIAQSAAHDLLLRHRVLHVGKFVGSTSLARDAKIQIVLRSNRAL